MRISWERSSDGKLARRLDHPPMVAIDLNTLAWRAFMDVTGIRARFDGDDAAFQPVLSILAKSRKHAIGWSLFIRDYPLIGGEGDPGPHLCLRTGTWDHAEAQRGLQGAENRREFLARSLPWRCVTRFFDSGAIPLAPLLAQTTQALSAGIAFKNCERVEQGGEIEWKYNDGSRQFGFAWFPATCSCPRLEVLLAEWRAVFDAGGRAAQKIPDDGFSIEYDASFCERLERDS